MIHTRAAAAIFALACAWPRPAAADWLITPFAGGAFAGRTNFVDLERAAGEAKRVFGGSAGLLGEGVIGLEVDFAYAPRFFQRDEGARLVVGSSVTTLTGNVIVAAPLSFTRDSLRPYLVAGLGLMRPRIDDVLDVFEVRSRLLGFDVGGGVVGFFTNRTGVRLDLRYFRNVSEEVAQDRVGFGATHLSYWRASAGLVLRR